MSGKWPLYLVLVASFVLQITAAVGLTLWLSFRNSQRAVNQLTTQLSEEAAARIEEHLESYLLQTNLLQDNSRSTIQGNDLDLSDFQALERHFWHQLQAAEGITSLYFGSSDGAFIGVQRRANGQWVLWTMPPEMVPERLTYRLNDQGLRLDILGRQAYDPRTRPWYEAAVEAQRPVWSPIYRFASEGYAHLGITPTVPLYDPDTNKLLGVLAIDLTLQQLSDFLGQMKVSASGEAFIIERTGAIVASSANEAPFVQVGDSQSRLLATESKVPLIQATANHLLETHGSFEAIRSAKHLNFSLDGEGQRVQVMPFLDERGLDWLIVTVIPERDVMGQIVANTRTTGLLCLLSLVIATLIAIATARWVVSPIVQLNQAAKSLAVGNWDQSLPASRFQEVSELTESFERMSHQLKQSFQQLEAQNADLQHFDRLKDEFLANTSHELKTPLQGIIGLAESLIDGATGPLPRRTKANLAMIVSSGRRLSNLVNDLLDFSQLRHNNVELRLQAVGIREAADVVLTLNQPMASQKDLQLINAVSPRLPLALADENRLQQILHNLVSNAVKFTDTGMIGISAQLLTVGSLACHPASADNRQPKTTDVAVSTGTSAAKKASGQSATPPDRSSKPSDTPTASSSGPASTVAPEQAFLAITVADTGVGIAADQQELIFQPFQQADGSTSRLYGGMGIGLAVTKQLVELHGGAIWVTSTVGGGSQFTFTLPVAAEPVVAAAPETSPQETSDAEHLSLPWPAIAPLEGETLSRLMRPDGSEGIGIPALETMSSGQNGGQHPNIQDLSNQQFTVLVVDDDPVNRQVIQNYLTLHHYHVITAPNGPEALNLLQAGTAPDLLLLDVMMPGMTGYEVARVVREQFPANELPIVMLTAKNQVANLVEGLGAGANDYIVKPVSKNELLARLKTHLHLAKINHAYSRFVPREFLQFLKKDSILEVQLGDQVQEHMSVLFADILDFTRLSEQMTPEENFRFINTFLSQMEPAISAHGGFIDKYIGDAIMALFSGSADDAVGASIDMLRRLADYNRKPTLPNGETLALGIGINTGQLMLGTVGGKNRMDGTVISDTVNVAARIERLTRLYRVSLLISHHTFLQLHDPNQYAMRVIDRVQVRGKLNYVSVYEVFEADPSDLRTHKLATKTQFETALLRFYQGALEEAIAGLHQCLEANPNDAVAQVYLERCHQRKLS